MTVWMEFTNSTPKRRALATKNVRTLREEGYSYEEIPDHLSQIDTGATAAPWEIYEPSRTFRCSGPRRGWGSACSARPRSRR
jgi:hypothetical protein